MQLLPPTTPTPQKTCVPLVILCSGWETNGVEEVISVVSDVGIPCYGIASLFQEESMPAIYALMHAYVLSRLSLGRLFTTLWTVAHQAPLSMGFSRKEYWSGLPGPLPGHLLDTVIELTSFMSPALAGRFFTTSATWEAHTQITSYFIWGPAKNIPSSPPPR